MWCRRELSACFHDYSLRFLFYSLMVGCMLLIIVGLSLVSMMINVIQDALEDAYMQLLMKILIEYQKKLAETQGDQLDATMGMMDAWNNNMAAKFLMPLMG